MLDQTEHVEIRPAQGGASFASSDPVPARSATLLGAVAPGVTLDTLPRRDLDKRELLTLATAVAADQAAWRHHVAFGSNQRHYVQLHRDIHVDVWVLCWSPADDTGWHDHDISSGAVAVVNGCLVEHNLVLGSTPLQTDVPAGTAYCFGPDHIHRLVGRDAASVSIHAYSPPLWRMGQYALSSDGVLKRSSVSYADELRPLDYA